MKLENHRLVPEGESISVEYLADAYHREITGAPMIAVVHYTVGLGHRNVAAYMRHPDLEYISAHVLISRSGHVVQMVPFSHVAYHAGPSSYRGRSGCNNFSLGIELENPGPVIRQPDGSWKTTQGQVWDGEVVEARHKSGLYPKWTHWAAYSREQVDLCGHICALWKKHYGIIDIVGHDDVAPGRKSDPGPLFPFAAVRFATFGEDYAGIGA